MTHKKYNWKQIYKEFLKTDMSPGAYARAHGLPSSCIYAQFKKLGYISEATVTNTPDVTPDIQETIDLIPVQIIPSENKETKLIEPKSSITVTICGATIQLKEGFNKALFKDVVEVLKELC